MAKKPAPKKKTKLGTGLLEKARHGMKTSTQRPMCKAQGKCDNQPTGTCK